MTSLSKISLSSHVLDTTLGKPAADMVLILTTPDGEQHQGKTDADGRCRDWGVSGYSAGVYSLRFMCKDYLNSYTQDSLYPFVDIHFEMTEDGGHYHIPLLISPFGFSSYRGS
ncbi:hydroxyisourate hydrolase [Planctobacterium marinum]|uniref:5-hydroxyisourate hydrolase n=1 Tax=Planctobacterium marinum TaxID=1631968 RepID=A0AA48HGC2_9ALTE|nr:5-hydroxyisourate hydrolase [Planctobacterium marinum]